MDTKAPFKPGDLVVLKSGGPEMTVKQLNSEDVICQWFAGKKLEQGRFNEDSLIKSPPKP